MIASKAGLGPGATGVDMPCAQPCAGAAVPTPKVDVYKDHGGSKCESLLALEFETTPAGAVGAKADAVLGAAKGQNSLHFGTGGWTNHTSCDMDDGCTSVLRYVIFIYTCRPSGAEAIQVRPKRFNMQ